MVAGVWLRPQFVTTATADPASGGMRRGTRGVLRGARTLLQPLIFVCLGRRQCGKKRIPKFYCYTRKITTARERVRGEGEEGSPTETETSTTAAGRRILATFPFPSMWKPSPSRGISKAITRQSQRRK